MIDTPLAEQIPLAVISTYILERAKKSRYFPWISLETEKLNRLAAVFVALCASAGVLVTFDHTAGVLTVSGLTVANLLHMAWRFTQQMCAQQVVYKTVIAPPRLPAEEATAK